MQASAEELEEAAELVVEADCVVRLNVSVLVVIFLCHDWLRVTSVIGSILVVVIADLIVVIWLVFEILLSFCFVLFSGFFDGLVSSSLGRFSFFGSLFRHFFPLTHMPGGTISSGTVSMAGMTSWSTVSH